MILNADSLSGALAALFGEGVRVLERRPVYGGDINQSCRLTLSDGTAVFMKANAPGNRSFFGAEAQGLEALRRTGTIGVPRALAIGTDEAQGISFLLMEYLEAASRIDKYWETFGRELAAMHRADCRHATRDGRLPYGFASDNFIGASPQINAPKESWIAFFRECRLAPQFQWAEGYFDVRTRSRFAKLLDHLGDYLPEPEFPSLLHGDLWSGNAVCGPDGRAWILDPAVYAGHFEAELAMTQLFGGFPAAFYGAYSEINRIDGSYRDRRDLYNLYHLLNHLNLFGGAYRNSVQMIVDRYV